MRPADAKSAAVFIAEQRTQAEARLIQQHQAAAQQHLYPPYHQGANAGFPVYASVAMPFHRVERLVAGAGLSPRFGGASSAFANPEMLRRSAAAASSFGRYRALRRGAFGDSSSSQANGGVLLGGGGRLVARMVPHPGHPVPQLDAAARAASAGGAGSVDTRRATGRSTTDSPVGGARASRGRGGTSRKSSPQRNARMSPGNASAPGGGSSAAWRQRAIKSAQQAGGVALQARLRTLVLMPGHSPSSSPRPMSAPVVRGA